MKSTITNSVTVSYDMNTSRKKLHQTQLYFYGQIGEH